MFTERQASIRALLREEGDDALLITAREDIRWTCGFSGSAGVLLLTDATATLFTDGRYTDQASEETQGAAVEVVSGDLVKAAGRHQSANSLASVAIDAATTPVAALRRVEAWPSKPRIRSYESPLAPYMAVKSDEEIRRLRKAQQITDAVYREILPIVRPGMTERELAAEIVYRHLRRGADGMSFEPIVASGPNGALPHARPTDRKLAAGDLVILDFGCFVEGYASDMTRTIALGMLGPETTAICNVVRDAQAAAQQAARSNIRASDLDEAGRSVIERAGFGSAFPHSLGHGIGLRIHEWPRIAATNSESLPNRAVVTIEPGIYIPGRFGVRIENSVILNQTGCETLPESSTEVVIV